MNDSQLASLKQSVCETLSSGMSVAVIGWKDSNHSSITRSLPDKKFLFFEDPPNSLGQNVGFVLFTRFVKHKDYDRFKDRKDCHAVVLGTGRIKEVFESCVDVLVTNPSDSLTVNTSKVAEVTVTTNDNPKNYPGDNDLLDFLTQPTKEISEMSEIDKFVSNFRNVLDRNSQGLVSSKTLGKLIEDSGIEKTPQQLVNAGWIESEAREGTKKAHWYKAGRLMSEHEDKQEKPLPETTVGRVELLMSQEPELKDEKIKHEERLAEINRKLAMIAAARTMFDQLESEFAKK